MQKPNRFLLATIVVSFVIAGSAASAAADAVSGTSSQGAGAFKPTAPDGSPQIMPQPGASSTTTSTDGAASPLSTGDLYKCDNLGVGYLCAWHDSGYTGTFWDWKATGSNSYMWNFVGTSANDEASSAYNHRANATLLGKDMPGSAPDIVCAPAEVAYYNFQSDVWPDGSGANDTISSFDFLGSNDCTSYYVW